MNFLINQGHTNYDGYDYSLYKVMQEFEKFQTQYTNHCWPAVFFENHDNPRIVSKVDKTDAYREDISKVCAVIEMTLRGTPYIYQGQEISMGNGDFDCIEQIDDAEAKGVYSELIKKADLPIRHLNVRKQVHVIMQEHRSIGVTARMQALPQVPPG